MPRDGRDKEVDWRVRSSTPISLDMAAKCGRSSGVAIKNTKKRRGCEACDTLLPCAWKRASCICYHIIGSIRGVGCIPQR